MWTVLKIIGWITGLGGALTALWLSISGEIRREAQLDYNNKQLEQVIKDRADLAKKIDELQIVQKNILDGMQLKNRDLDSRIANIDQYIHSQKAQPVSPVIRETVKKLRKVK